MNGKIDNRNVTILPKSGRELPTGLNPEVEELNCPICGRFLAYIAIVEGTVAVYCKTCKDFIVVNQTQLISENPEQGIDNETNPG